MMNATMQVGAANVTPFAAPALNPPQHKPTGRALSPSQVNAFLECSFAWYCRKELGLADPPTASLAIGRAVHRAAAAALRGKGAGVEVSADELVADFYAGFAREELSQAQLAPDESQAEAADRGAAMVREWHSSALPRIRPVVVERDIWATIAGVHVRGTVDVIDHGACVIDTKTASRKPSGVSAAHRLQLATYATILELTWARTDTLVCTSRSTSYVPQSFQITEDDRKLVRTIYPAVQAQMDAGLFSPNRNSPFCSRHCCRFWQACEREWGGQVKE